MPGYIPTMREMINLETPYDVRLSPDGNLAAILVRTVNWRDNQYESTCLVYQINEKRTWRLTQAGSVEQAEWLDNECLALLRTFDGGSGQVWIYDSASGGGWAATDHKGGIDGFKPFAGGFIYIANDPERAEKKPRRDRYGRYVHFEQEESASALYYMDVSALRLYRRQERAASEEEAKKLVKPVLELSKLFKTPLNIAWVVPSPTGDAVYLNCQTRDDLVYWREGSVWRLAVDVQAALAEHSRRAEVKQAQNEEPAAAGELEGEKPVEDSAEEKKEDYSYLGELKQLPLPRVAHVRAISPDGSQLLISFPSRDERMFTQEELWTLPVAEALAAPDATACRSAMRGLMGDLDREAMRAVWVEAGIFCQYVDNTVVRLAKLSQDAPPQPLDLGGLYLTNSFSAANSGRIGFTAGNAATFTEACFADPAANGETWQAIPLTQYGKQVENWELGRVEKISWTSRDGTTIEGILRKPDNFDPSRRYPLVFVPHGGPTWFSGEYLLSGEDCAYYPAVQFASKDILVLKPNYRGSVGRGQAFQELNKDNLGVGDLWDLESAIDHLVDLGWVDADKVGCMGWSQGGYISAFAGLRSERFKAVSVGAGISDWYTYHISNDIPDFTTDYLSASPFRERGIYEKTAPISGLATAKTPMLIQHGSDDQRVPLSNATELYRGLKEMGIPVELFIFPGMGHPITRPRENHAVMSQNLAWFSHYLLGEELKLE